MNKMCKTLLSLFYIVLLGVVSFFNASEVAKELFNNNESLIIIINVFLNGFIFILNIVIMGFFYRIFYKISTKVTLENKDARSTTLTLLMPLFYTRLIILACMYIIGVKSMLLLLLFINPLIYIFQLKKIEGVDDMKRKAIILLPFIVYEVIDIIGIASNLI